MAIMFLRSFLYRLFFVLDKHYLGMKFFARNQLVLGLFLGIFYRYMSSNVVLFFNKVPPKTEHFARTRDVLKAIERSEYTTTAIYRLLYDDILYPLKHAGKTEVFDRLIKTHKYNPGFLSKNTDQAPSTAVGKLRKTVTTKTPISIRSQGEYNSPKGMTPTPLRLRKSQRTGRVYVPPAKPGVPPVPWAYYDPRFDAVVALVFSHLSPTMGLHCHCYNKTMG